MTVSLQGLHPGDGRGAAAAWFAKCDAFHALKKHKHRYIITYDHILRARNDARASGCAAAAPIGTIGTGRRSSACPETLRVDAGADPAGPLTDSLRRPWSAPSAACNLRQVWHPARAFGSSGSRSGLAGRSAGPRHRRVAVARAGADIPADRAPRGIAAVHPYDHGSESVRNLGWHAPCNRGGRKACGKKAKRDARKHGDARKIHSRRNIKRQE